MEKYQLYNKEIELTFNPDKHIYQIGDKIIPSVTGIVGIISKPALIYWAVNKAVDYLKGEWLAGKSYDEIEIGKHLENAKYAHRKTLKDSAEIGTLGHKWIEEYIKGLNPETPVNPSLKAITEAFLSWEKANKVKFLQSEIKIYSKKYGYAGTMDFEAEVNGKLVLGDIKTSTAIYPEMRLQLAAYRQAREEETGQKYDHQLIIRLGKLLNKDGTPDWEIKEFSDFDKDFKGFLGALLLSNRINDYKSEVISTTK